MAESSVKRIQFANAAGFLISSGSKNILIDTGHSNTTEKFHKVIERLGISAQDISLIVLTHTHFDHCGGAAALKETTGAPLAVHRSESQMLEKGRTPFPKGTRWKGKLLAFVGNVLMKRMSAYPPVKADLLIDEELDLKDYGVPGKVIHTPGHTEGSLSVILKSGQAFVGDNLLGIYKKEHFPPFANNPKGVIESWEKYISEGVKVLYPAHGSKVRIETIIEELPEARVKYL